MSSKEGTLTRRPRRTSGAKCYRIMYAGRALLGHEGAEEHRRMEAVLSEGYRLLFSGYDAEGRPSPYRHNKEEGTDVAD